MRAHRISAAEEAQKAYPCATESPIPGWADGLSLAREWFGENLGRHVEGFHLEGNSGEVVSHVCWTPSESALVPYRVETGAAFIYCEWVQRRHRGQGNGRFLFQVFIDFLRKEGCKGVLANGTEIKDYMHHRHFVRRGFQTIREAGGGSPSARPLTKRLLTWLGPLCHPKAR